MDVITVLATNLAVLAAGFFILWLVCIALKDCTIVDAYWALGAVVLAVSTFLQSGQGDRAVLLLVITGLWGARLTAYMYWRWRDHGPDRRYKRMFERLKEEKGWGFARASLIAVILTQAPLQFLVTLPVQLGPIDAVPAALGILAWTGAAIALFGLVFESIADWQLTRFRKNPANAGKVMQHGLWKYSRHPNYFGEALVWWGLFLIAAETSTGLWSFAGPAFLTWTLIKWSGAPTMEYRMRKTKPDYVAYIERTSGFIPWPPRKA
ncbi:MAG: DUF1295 domain-containing protein [Glycocaulis sp.]